VPGGIPRQVQRLDQGQPDAAADIARIATQRDPLAADPLFELAAIEQARGRSQEAETALAKAVELEPANAETWRRLGELRLTALNDPQGALRAFQAAYYLDPHAPYAPPREYLDGEPAPGMGAAFEGQKQTMEGWVVTTSDERRWVRSLYDAEARYVDANVGRIVAALKQRSLYDDALVILTADHGEEFWEHGSLGHGQSMYQELLQVPLIVKLPASRRRAVETKVVATPVSTVSVTPTVLDVAGVPYSPREMSATSLAPALDGAALQPTPIVSTAQMLFDRRETVLFDRYRYIVSTLDGHVELYDHGTDPGEQHSIADSSPELVARGAALLAAHNADARALARRLGLQESTRAIDETTLRRLRSLGYVK